MYYFRKLWLWLLFILGMGMIVLHYGYRLLAMILPIIFKFSQLDMNEYNSINNRIYEFSNNGYELLLIILLLTIPILVSWLALNLISGQFQRDIYSDRFTRSLIRHIPTEIKLVSSEEKRANWWIRKGRIVKKHGKLVLRIPCGNNAAIVDIIRRRCDGYANQWLAQNYPNSNWSPLEIKHGLFITWLYIREK
ncbi:hypothetical protein [Ligilactobacillus salivarius]|uniref:hypothetical protein n=1 Tax=Ligilactobacillus salivarius TaxID=1624 RepID=UPI002107F6DD|nr:hypothetical protein [Ligilactobacillus salivarius]UTX36526.1 hypothetical protein NNL28_07405 [Ligilactobacillus salivarius]